ncbi:MAG: HD domain-containing protein [Burkholderiales bacterium]|nr:HD domain-containing protein [Burkholderiales bacterium]
MMNTTDSRRRFLKTSGRIAAAIAAGQTFPALAGTSPTVSAISFDQCQAMTPIQSAQNSTLVQQAWKRLQNDIASIKNPRLRSTITDIYNDPTPRLTADIDIKSRQTLRRELAAKNYTDSSWENLLPNVPHDPKKLMPFIAAPGSGYYSHHAYPGGLVTHVATNVQITKSIIDTYTKVYGYSVDRDLALSAQLLHDLHKPYVFQWQEDGSSRKEQSLGGTGEHHCLSAAELIARHAPPELVIAMISAHQAASNQENEKQLVGWLDAAAIIAGVDPVAYGLISSDRRLPDLPRQEGFICHLGDHDFVLSVPAVVATLPIMREIAVTDYKISESDLNGKVFNSLRNHIYSTYSAMRLHEALSKAGKNEVRRLMFLSVLPVA